MRRVRWKGAWVAVAAVIAALAGTGAVLDVTDRPAWRCSAEDGCYPKPPGYGSGSVGIPPGTVLRPCGENATIATEGAVIDGCEYTGSVLIAAADVEVRNSRIHGAIRTQNANDEASFTLEDSELGPDVDGPCGGIEALIGIQNYTSRRNYLHRNGDGWRVSGDNVLIEDNFILLCSNPEDHGDGIQGFGGGTNVVIRHNTIDQRPAVDYTAPVFFADNSSAAHLFDNLLLAPNGSGDPNIQSSASAAIKLHRDGDRPSDENPRWVARGNRLIGRAGNVNNTCTLPETVWEDNRQVTVGADYKITGLGGFVSCAGVVTGGG